MKIQFNALDTLTGKVSVSLDNGENYTEYNVADVKDTGIELDDSQDFSKIIIKGSATTLSNLNVLKSIDIEGLKKDITLQTKIIEENGDVVADTGFDGLEKVTVAVPEKTLKDIEFTENGTYTPDDTFDGYDSVLVNVPTTETKELRVTTNGEYVAETGKAYSKVTVSVSGAEADYSGYIKKQYVVITLDSTDSIKATYPTALHGFSVNTILDNLMDADDNSLRDYTTDAGLLREYSAEPERRLYARLAGSGADIETQFYVRIVIQTDEA